MNKIPSISYFFLLAGIFVLLFLGKVNLDLSAFGSHLIITSN